MVWNLDFDIAAWFIFIILIGFYVSRRNLPIRRNYAFFFLMINALALNTMDIVGSITASYPAFFSSQVIYATNVIYYLILALYPLSFFTFLTLTVHPEPFGKFRFFCHILPAALIFVASLLSPWIHFVFYLDEANTFSYGPGRNLFFWETMLYLGISVLYVFFYGQTSLIIYHRMALICFIVCTTIGFVTQFYLVLFHQTVPLTSMISILIVFLVIQNPDFYRDQRTGFFDARGLQLVIAERLRKQQRLVTAGIVIENYNTLKSSYSEEVVAALLHQVSLYLKTLIDHSYVFYLRNGIFITLLDTVEYHTAMQEQAQLRFQEPFIYKNNEYYLYPKFFVDLGQNSYKSYENYRATLVLGIQELRQCSESAIRISEEMNQSANRIFVAERALNTALQNNAVEVFYQPIFSAESGKINSAEALARIRGADGKYIMPDEFIAIAERNGSISRLGEQVFEKVCQFIANHDMDEMGMEYIEVNLSPIQCRRSNTAQNYINIMDRYRIPPSFINIEITETADSENEYVMANINQFISHGIRLSLDDYGTGYSNLIHTLSLPFTIIKLDKAIVHAYFYGRHSILEALIANFSQLGKKLVAEGVETPEMADALIKFGCHYLQGFLYSVPIPEEEFADFMLGQHQQ